MHVATNFTLSTAGLAAKKLFGGNGYVTDGFAAFLAP